MSAPARRLARNAFDELADTDEGPLRVNTISPAVVDDEYRRATAEGMAPLIGLGMLRIAALLLLFMQHHL